VNNRPIVIIENFNPQNSFHLETHDNEQDFGDIVDNSEENIYQERSSVVYTAPSVNLSAEAATVLNAIKESIEGDIRTSSYSWN